MTPRLRRLAVALAILAILSTAHVRVGAVTVHVAALALVLVGTACAALILYALRQVQPPRLALGWVS